MCVVENKDVENLEIREVHDVCTNGQNFEKAPMNRGGHFLSG